MLSRNVFLLKVTLRAFVFKNCNIWFNVLSICNWRDIVHSWTNKCYPCYWIINTSGLSTLETSFGSVQESSVFQLFYFSSLEGFRRFIYYCYYHYYYYCFYSRGWSTGAFCFHSRLIFTPVKDWIIASMHFSSRASCLGSMHFS